MKAAFFLNEKGVLAVPLSFCFVVLKPHDTTVSSDAREMPFTTIYQVTT